MNSLKHLEKVVYICHPFINDPVGNKEKVTKILDDIIFDNLKKWGKISHKSLNFIINEEEYIITPLSVFHAFPPSMNESEKVSRELVMFYCKSLLRKCDELWLYSEHGISEGMIEEIGLASFLGIPIKVKS